MAELSHGDGHLQVSVTDLSRWLVFAWSSSLSGVNKRFDGDRDWGPCLTLRESLMFGATEHKSLGHEFRYSGLVEGTTVVCTLQKSSRTA